MKNSIEDDVKDFFNFLKSELPSKDLSGYWISHYTDKEYPKHTNYGGKWLIFSSKLEIDDVWKKIKIAQDNGLLGDMSKVSTAINYDKYKHHVICIYTYDSKDEKDVLRVREGLRNIGFDSTINYKRDIETRKGIYGKKNEFLLTI